MHMCPRTHLPAATPASFLGVLVKSAGTPHIGPAADTQASSNMLDLEDAADAQASSNMRDLAEACFDRSAQTLTSIA
eukprot:1158128-Pelagomonas_calceolata.AAC.6